jgi:hypothetical protein
MEAASFSETLVSYCTTRRHNPELQATLGLILCFAYYTSSGMTFILGFIKGDHLFKM